MAELHRLQYFEPNYHVDIWGNEVFLSPYFA